MWSKTVTEDLKTAHKPLRITSTLKRVDQIYASPPILAGQVRTLVYIHVAVHTSIAGLAFARISELVWR